MLWMIPPGTVGQEKLGSFDDTNLHTASRAAAPPAAPISSSLRAVLSHMPTSTPADATVRNRVLADFSNPLVRVGPAGDVQTYVYVASYGVAEAAMLRDHGAVVELVDDSRGIVQAWTPFAEVEAIARLPFVTRITPPGYPTPRVGSVTTEGDVILNAAALRALGVRGSGVKVGVIGPGLEGLSTAQASDDVPEITEVEPIAPSIGEGTALLEIIHDIAPEAELAFCGPETDLEMVQCIEQLVNDFGADILVDDLGFFNEPYFEDGPVAQAAAQAVAAGVIYASAAGNDADVHYEGDFVGFDAGADGMLHDFGVAAGQTSDTDLDLLLDPGESVTVLLQWNDPFGASSNNYDLFLRDEAEALLTSSTDIQGVAGANPEETLFFTNRSGVPRRVKVAIRLVAGEARRLEMFFLGSGVVLEEYGVPAGSVFGHPAVVGVLATGAMRAGNALIEPFTSQGPARIDFPAPESRPKPDITATDGVSVSGAGPFPQVFFGTSAAAPHVAGIAALLKSAAPAASATAIRTAIRDSAEDIGPAGTDSITGAGLIDALAAAGLLTTLPEPSDTGAGIDGEPSDTGDGSDGESSDNGDGSDGGGCTLRADAGFDGTLLGLFVLALLSLGCRQWRRRRAGSA